MENIWENTRRLLARIPLPVIVLGAFVLGFLLKGGREVEHVHDSGEVTASAEVTEWTCSMHPQIRRPKQGKCPICAMDLIPVTVEEDEGELGPGQIKLSAASRELAEIQTAGVEIFGQHASGDVEDKDHVTALALQRLRHRIPSRTSGRQDAQDKRSDQQSSLPASPGGADRDIDERQ